MGILASGTSTITGKCSCLVVVPIPRAIGRFVLRVERTPRKCGKSKGSTPSDSGFFSTLPPVRRGFFLSVIDNLPARCKSLPWWVGSSAPALPSSLSRSRCCRRRRNAGSFQLIRSTLPLGRWLQRMVRGSRFEVRGPAAAARGRRRSDRSPARLVAGRWSPAR